ncbi:MAG: zf-HC2 domain-containing protein [Acidobacteriota bacterium]|nr:zf-HC2 domain-containing protein [Acidobacteriota bacterium]MDH3784819.1 zf-HC2 domain-containing protein [Acidobacteriota bacterium]
MNHRRARLAFSEARAGRLSDRSRQRLESHLARCAKCHHDRTAEARIATELATLRTSTTAEDQVLRSVDVRQAVLGQLPASPTASRHGLPWRELGGLSVVAMVGSVVLVAALAQSLPQAVEAARTGAGLLEVGGILLASVWRAVVTVLEVPFVLLGTLVEPLERLFRWLRTMTPAIPALVTTAYMMMTGVVLFVIGRDLRQPRITGEEG